MKRIALLAAALTALALPAAAHTPYLVPFTFAPTEPLVTVHNGLTDISFFVPEFPIKGDDYDVTAPDGTITRGTGITLTQLGLFEAKLGSEGTYRISTGNRDVRTLNLAEVDGKWRAVKMPEGGVVPEPYADQSKLPAGARIIPVKTMVRSETYVSFKKPSEAAPKPDGKGLELEPLTHPNKLFAGSPFPFRIAFDGKPEALHWTVSRANDAYADKSYSASGETGADGKGQVTFSEPGIYVIEVIRKWQQGDQNDPRTWIYTLTLEVTP